MLQPLTIHTDPNLLVGLQTSDDAAVYLVAPGVAIVQTVDFFTPIVDDPWTYGAIAAANAMSDIFAMGGDVLFALNIAAVPDTLPPEVITAIFQGASDKVQETGTVIAGGHTVTDAEPKFGLCVTGRIDPDRILSKGGLCVGDRLYLTKPIGTGVIATAAKRGMCAADHLQVAVETMLRLNQRASIAARSIPSIRACTDITGFGLLGHASEMAQRSGVRVRIAASNVPQLPGAREYAEQGAIAGGLTRNRAYFTSHAPVELSAAVDPTIVQLLFDPQTSGGLLIGVSPADAAALESAFADHGVFAAAIGEVVAGSGIDVVP